MEKKRKIKKGKKKQKKKYFEIKTKKIKGRK